MWWPCDPHGHAVFCAFLLPPSFILSPRNVLYVKPSLAPDALVSGLATKGVEGDD